MLINYPKLSRKKRNQKYIFCLSFIVYTVFQTQKENVFNREQWKKEKEICSYIFNMQWIFDVYY